MEMNEEQGREFCCREGCFSSLFPVLASAEQEARPPTHHVPPVSLSYTALFPVSKEKVMPKTRSGLGHDRGTDRNRRASSHRSPLSRVPLEKLFPGRKDVLVYRHPNSNLPDTSSLPQRRPGPDDPHWKIPAAEWHIVLHRVDQGEPLRKVAGDYGVSYETVRRVIRAARAGMESSG